ncbi:MAG: hypothetical protein IPJ65_28745 [Archangiaceae bacterium]|nr:hypothetical protein [Archangiaceae bacterium]
MSAPQPSACDGTLRRRSGCAASRILLVALALCLAACRCEPPPKPSDSALRADPAALDFGAVPLSAALTREVQVLNTGRSPRTATVTTSAPFTASLGTVTLAGGATGSLRLTFAPTSLGQATAVLRLATDDATLEVPLTGTGGEACLTTTQCFTSRFDAEQHTCVEQPLPDGSACSNSCLATASCQQGRCVGTAVGCDDHDACTVDACADDGHCFHSPRLCPVLDACRVASCDSSTGCASQPLEDGTACGPETCAEARICLGGACTTRPKPNAATDCAYTRVAAGDAHTCVESVGGAVYCWGQPRGFATSSRALAARERVPALAGALELSVSNTGTCGLFDGGSVGCVGSGTFTASPFSAPVLKLDGPCALLDGGAVACPSGFNLLDDGGTFGSSGAAAFTVSHETVCIAFQGGATECRSRLGTHLALEVTFDATPVDLTAGAGWVCALLPGGALQCSGAGAAPQTLVASGATALGGDDEEVCWAEAGGVRCQRLPSEPPHPVAVPGPVRALTQHGGRHVCASTAAREVFCWGDNTSGQLGDRSPQPRGVVELSPGQVTQLSTADQLTVAVIDGGLVSFGQGFTRLDGGAAPSGQAVLGLAPPSLASLAVTRDVGCLLTTFGAVSCWGSRPTWVEPRPLTFVSLPAPASGLARCTADLSPLCAVADGQAFGLGRFAPGPAVAGPTGVRQLEGNFALKTDGGVDRRQFMPPQGYVSTPVALPRPVLKLAAQPDSLDDLRPCALLDDGTAVCWQCAANGPCTAAEPLSGVWPLSRQLVGNAWQGCALFGANGVRCWGANDRGQLGRDGLDSSLTALDVAMPEAVDRLSSSATHVCALTNSRRALCWGSNLWGQLGVPVLRQSAVPLKLE